MPTTRWCPWTQEECSPNCGLFDTSLGGCCFRSIGRILAASMVLIQKRGKKKEEEVDR